ncbi:MAG: bifunctional folylpolyglutamate synthase/dihydrofolate synthase, partial [Lachnospiraceae bacterium]
MNYEEALDYIHGLYWRGKKSGLEKTKELLELCGHPESGLRVVHIAGTNGKGSSAAMLASVCQSAGLR